MGMARRKPKNASAAPMVELALSGLTVSALLRLTISGLTMLGMGQLL